MIFQFNDSMLQNEGCNNYYENLNEYIYGTKESVDNKN